MDLDGDYIIAGNKVATRSRETRKVDGISGVVRWLSRPVDGAGRHVKVVELLTVDIEKGTIIDYVTKGDGCRRCRWGVEMITEIERVMIRAGIEARNRGLYRVRQTATIL